MSDHCKHCGWSRGWGLGEHSSNCVAAPSPCPDCAKMRAERDAFRERLRDVLGRVITCIVCGYLEEALDVIDGALTYDAAKGGT